MNTSKVAKEVQTPLKRFAYATTVTCSAQASVYAKCIAANYADVRKDMCREEFGKFVECLRTTLKRKW